jgi:hypothetical protein
LEAGQLSAPADRTVRRAIHATLAVCGLLLGAVVAYVWRAPGLPPKLLWVKIRPETTIWYRLTGEEVEAMGPLLPETPGGPPSPRMVVDRIGTTTGGRGREGSVEYVQMKSRMPWLMSLMLRPTPASSLTGYVPNQRIVEVEGERWMALNRRPLWTPVLPEVTWQKPKAGPAPPVRPTPVNIRGVPPKTR